MKVMAGVADAKREARRLLDSAVTDAWNAYLTACRTARLYETVEPWAWDRLQQQLAALDRRRKKVGR